YIFGQQRIWAVYFGVISTSISAILAIIHMKLYDRKRMKEIHKLIRNQQVVHNQDKKAILQELVLIAFPYLLVAVLGYSDSMINLMFLPRGLAQHGDVLQTDAIIGAITLGVNKLMSIPMILAPGFSAAIIPYVTTAISNRNKKLVQKHMRDCVDSVLYIGLPISFCLFAFAKPIYYVLFNPGETLELCSQILSWYSIEAFIATISPIFTALMMAAGLRKRNIQNQFISVALKIVITYPMIVWLGYPGAVLSSFLSMGIFVLLDAYAIWKYHQIEWRYTLRKMIFMLIGVVGIAVVAFGMQQIGFKGYDVGRIQAMIELGISGLFAIAVYIGITASFQLPQMIFHIDFANILEKVRRR
ncbi:MAG: polysaccharide biosynthesis C-terminal domain-containing protein, partial [Erysipelotrichaceae bacterium]|nr:polysaccharide biosynthesis C-terminal domain-containing protein [Erysipelotrichaceae bacterium]